MQDTVQIRLGEKEEAAPELGRGTIALMAGAAGLSVASLYYNQPMLGILAGEFAAEPASVSWVAVLTQFGYALGLVALAPLGDRFERRGLIALTFAGLALALFGAALAPGLGTMLAASLLVGVLATVAQQVVPMAAHLAGEARRGSVVGTVMAGLLTGILLSRTVSGLVAAYADWRDVYAGAALAALAACLVLAVRLPRVEPTTTLSYGRILLSLAGLFRRHAALRRAGLVQALLFAGFVAFWAELAFYLERPPFSQGSAMAGLLGLVGAVGVVAAPLVGRLADRGGKGRLVTLGAAALTAGFAVMGLFPGSWIGLVAGIVLVDVGLQSALVANQARIYGLDPAARSRINTVFMAVMFLGGGLGSALGAQAFAALGWTGVWGLGAGCGLAALAVERLGRRPA